MQLQMFDSREAPTATAEMLADRGLRAAIKAVRQDGGGDRSGWPFVEKIGAIGEARAWAVDDHGVRYVVLNGVVFRRVDLWFAIPMVRKAAQAAFARFDAEMSV